MKAAIQPNAHAKVRDNVPCLSLASLTMTQSKRVRKSAALTRQGTIRPTGPASQRRPPDVVGNAVHVMKVLVGEGSDEELIEATPDPAARAMGKLGGTAKAARVRGPAITDQNQGPKVDLDRRAGPTD